MLSIINKDVRLNYGQLNSMLTQLGYQSARAAGGHIVYKHNKKNSLVAVRHSRKTTIVPEMVVSSIIKNVVNANVANEAEVEDLVAHVQ